MTQAQREVTNHIEFQASLLNLLAVPESYRSAQTQAVRKSESADMLELVALARAR